MHRLIHKCYDKNYLFLLLGLLLAACSSDDKDEQPILVTNVVMPASGTVFKPGEKVTIMAKGFQDNDEIMFDIRWPLQDEVLHEGYAKGGRGVITEKTATSITFLAPGHWPASTTEILLRRSGQMMSLGKISVADGQAPKDFRLMVSLIPVPIPTVLMLSNTSILKSLRRQR